MESGKEKFLIKGLAGKKKLSGSIEIGGSKNIALKLLPATILFKDSVHFENVPDITDVKRILELLQDLGGEIIRNGNHSYSINTSKISGGMLNKGIAKRLRASVVCTGPLLARFNEVSFPHPGGCVIGERPIDLFLENFKKMGGVIEERNEEYIVRATKGLKGTKLVFKFISVTGTETFMMAAILSKGTTIIHNAATEPEVVHLGEFLKSRGAKIEGLGTHTIIIDGGRLLENKNQKYYVPPDRIETGSFLILGALAAENLEIKNCLPEELEIPIEMLRQSGVEIKTTKNTLTVSNNGKNRMSGMNLKTHEYPGFPTDLQAPMVVYLTQTSGDSLVFETIFEGRLSYTEDLVRMGAKILMLDHHRIMVKGPTPLRGRELESPDLRAGLAFLMASIIAKGESTLNTIEYIDRGYESIEKRLTKLGVKIERVR